MSEVSLKISRLSFHDNMSISPNTITTITDDLLAQASSFPGKPDAQQHWVHSCCSRADLTCALADESVTAIEADIMIAPAHVARRLQPMAPGQTLPVMAHPTLISVLAGRAAVPTNVDLSFATFLERCIADGKKHLKLDFKQLAAVEPCLELLARRWTELCANGQAVWLNADVLPGPNKQREPDVPASVFIPLCRRYCPDAQLSLGWTVGPLGPEQSYSSRHIEEMLDTCAEYGLPGHSVVFAINVRFSCTRIGLIVRLLDRLPGSQLLLWTGSGEMPIEKLMQDTVHSQLMARGLASRVGYDVAIATSPLDSCAARAADWTFTWSRFTRRLLCSPACISAHCWLPRWLPASSTQHTSVQEGGRIRGNERVSEPDIESPLCAVQPDCVAACIGGKILDAQRWTLDDDGDALVGRSDHESSHRSAARCGGNGCS